MKNLCAFDKSITASLQLCPAHNPNHVVVDGKGTMQLLSKAETRVHVGDMTHYSKYVNYILSPYNPAKKCATNPSPSAAHSTWVLPCPLQVVVSGIIGVKGIICNRSKTVERRSNNKSILTGEIAPIAISRCGAKTMHCHVADSPDHGYE